MRETSFWLYDYLYKLFKSQISLYEVLLMSYKVNARHT